MTIASDEEVEDEDVEEEEEEEEGAGEEGAAAEEGWAGEDMVLKGFGERLRPARKRKRDVARDPDPEHQGGGEENDGAVRGERIGGEDDEEDDEEARRRAREEADFFAEGAAGTGTEVVSAQDEKQQQTFAGLSLSRALLRALQRKGFVRPTAVQWRVIPLALAGRDICASAVTGSGKTAAFLLPALERLLFKPADVLATRVLIVMPTRELATQCFEMLQDLAQFVDVTSCLITGGNKNLKSQEADLRKQPDIVICTPGRMIDHLTNSPNIHCDDVEILVLDEADRLLDLGFTEAVQEIVRYCPVGRQTMLFTATMTTPVADLVKLSLHHPVRVKVDPAAKLAPRLEQEFVKIRPRRENERAAITLALIQRQCPNRTIVFFDTKKEAHQFHLRLRLLGISSGELHGNMSQQDRLQALQRFKARQANVLVATDLAARGLDIEGVRHVINFTMPRSVSTYIHRVGRTARAGRKGRSITLLGERGRVVAKDVIKGMDASERALVKGRVVPPAVIDAQRRVLDAQEDELERIAQEESEERALRRAEMEADKATNLLQHSEDIQSRPARVWYQSEAQKKATRTAAAAAVGGGAKTGQNAHHDSASSAQSEGRPKQEKRGMSRRKRRRLAALQEAKREREEKAERRRTNEGVA